MIDRDPLHCCHRFPAEILARAVKLYFRFPLSLSMFGVILTARRTVVSHQMIRMRAEKFGRTFPMTFADARPAGLETNGDWTKSSSRSEARNTGYGAPSTRTVSFSMGWCKACATPGRQIV